MNENIGVTEDNRKFQQCIAASKQLRWDIDEDVFRDRHLDTSRAFLPDGLSKVKELTFLSPTEQRLLSQIQGRTYANVFGLVERFINAKVHELSQDYLFGDQVALEAMIRFSDEELKHQEMFRRLEKMAGEQMPSGYRFMLDPNDVAAAVLSKSSWAVLLLTLHIELFTQAHYLESIQPHQELCPLWKDVFAFHWKEEALHAIMDEIEFLKEDSKLTESQRSTGVQEVIELIQAVNSMLVVQADADASYFTDQLGRNLTDEQNQQVHKQVLKAYQWQFIYSGFGVKKFMSVVQQVVTEDDLSKVTQALGAMAA